MIYRFIALFLGFLLDCIIGDPQGMPHPICLIGNMISYLEKKLRMLFPKTEKGELLGGGALVALTILATGLISSSVVYAVATVSGILGFIVEVMLYWLILAPKCLAVESTNVKTALENEGLEAGQDALSMIVGRDTKVLDEVGVIKGAVETVAENTCDGVIAPILYCLLGGITGGFIYKAINTMDSMVGYKNPKYLYFGRVAAKLDDIANFIPARISAIFMILSAPILGFDINSAFKIWRRDNRKHASPNSAQTESVVAGALGIQLAGNAVYGGVVHEKPYIGDYKRSINSNDIINAIKLMYGSTVISFIVAFVVILALGI